MQNSLLYISETIVDLLGRNTVIIIPVLVSLIVFFSAIKARKIDLVVAYFFMIILPATTPFFTNLSGSNYFTGMNHVLQHDETLITSAIIIITTFSISYLVGGRRTANSGNWPEIPKEQLYCFGLPILIIVFSVNAVLILMFLESDTVLFKAYGEVKIESSGLYGSTVHQLFNLSTAILLASIPNGGRLKVVRIIIAIFIVLALVMARRTLAVGLACLFIYTIGREKLNLWHILLFVLTILALWFVGEARSVGIFKYLEGVRIWNEKRDWFNLPGGASNIFVGTIGVIDLLASNVLRFPQTIPVFLWPFGTNESAIYRQSGYDYNGGMHLANVFYWNIGYIGVIIGGYIIGKMVRYTNNQMITFGLGSQATINKVIAIAIVLSLPSLIWYSPIGMIRLAIATITSYYILYLLGFIVNTDIRIYRR